VPAGLEDLVFHEPEIVVSLEVPHPLAVDLDPPDLIGVGALQAEGQAQVIIRVLGNGETMADGHGKLSSRSAICSGLSAAGLQRRRGHGQAHWMRSSGHGLSLPGFPLAAQNDDPDRLSTKIRLFRDCARHGILLICIFRAGRLQ
jgi:hypothetical protein